jgi:chromosome condensin MukBEF MukE localization factor
MSFGAASDSNGSIAGGALLSAAASPDTAVQKKTAKARANGFLKAIDMVLSPASFHSSLDQTDNFHCLFTIEITHFFIDNE